MAILLDDDVARVLAIEKPVADLLLVRRVAGAHRQAAGQPRRADLADRAQLARLHDVERRAVVLAVSLLVIHRNALGLVGLLRRLDHALAARRIDAGRLLHEDVLARRHRRLEMLRMQVWRRGDQHRVHVARQQIFVVLECLRARNTFSPAVELIVVDIADRRDARELVLREHAATYVPLPPQPSSPMVSAELACEPRTSAGSRAMRAGGRARALHEFAAVLLCSRLSTSRAKKGSSYRGPIILRVPMKLSILVPVYNERAVVERSLALVLAAPLPERYGARTDYRRRLLHGRDLRHPRSAWRAADPRIRLYRHEVNQGKGAAVRTCIQHATGDFCLVQDADLEYDPVRISRS